MPENEFLVIDRSDCEEWNIASFFWRLMNQLFFVGLLGLIVFFIFLLLPLLGDFLLVLLDKMRLSSNLQML